MAVSIYPGQPMGGATESYREDQLREDTEIRTPLNELLDKKRALAAKETLTEEERTKLADLDDQVRAALAGGSRRVRNPNATARQWADWLRAFGPEQFFLAFLDNAQDAEGVCVQCGQTIYLDIAEGGGVADWRTRDGDYGCDLSPDTTDEGTGSHMPKRRGSA